MQLASISFPRLLFNNINQLFLFLCLVEFDPKKPPLFTQEFKLSYVDAAQTPNI